MRISRLAFRFHALSSALRRLAHQMMLFGAVGCNLVLGACNSDKLVDAAAPATGVDPATFRTAQGAQMLFNHAVAEFHNQFWAGSRPVVWYTGIFSDELTGGSTDDGNFRREPEPVSNHTNSIAPQYYRQLQGVRLAIEAAIPPMQQYAPLAPKALVGQLFALSGYTVLWLGEHFCAGTPVSTVVYGGDIIYGEPLTTEQISLNAAARFDSSLVYAADSALILNLARVGKGRALLNAGRFAEAAVAVKDVPTSFAYEVVIDAPQNAGSEFTNVFFQWTGGTSTDRMVFSTVADREGTNGLDYVSASANNDPRVRLLERGTERVATNIDRNSPVVLANGAEARLIEAEAALRANDIAGWTAKLNALRATCAASNPTCPAAMAPLTADSTTTASQALRIDVMFRERAFWLFLTGHRMGDMRRVVRQYNRPQQSVFPVGDVIFRGQFIGTYGSNVNYAPDFGEYRDNPKFHGCLDRAA